MADLREDEGDSIEIEVLVWGKSIDEGSKWLRRICASVTS